MISPKCIVLILVVSYASGISSKPFEKNVFEGRGIGSTLWDWITYPFYWWASSDESASSFNPMAGPTTRGPYDNVQVGNRNVTIWCNEHTCTTMKCDKRGCSNTTCNIYDTDINGECRVYNTNVSAEDKPVTIAIESTDSPTETTAALANEPVEEAAPRPLELEAVLSSTVPEKIPSKSEVVQKKTEPTRPNKV